MLVFHVKNCQLHIELLYPLSPHNQNLEVTGSKNSPEWCAAMKAGIKALELNDTYTLVDLPPDKKAIGCKWLYKIKF